MDPHAPIDALTVAFLAKQDPERCLYHFTELPTWGLHVYRVHARCVPQVRAKRLLIGIVGPYDVTYGPRCEPSQNMDEKFRELCHFCGRVIT